MLRLKNRMEECQRSVRIVAIGSSNTERPLGNGNTNNWFDWLDLGFRWWFGRFHVSINSGISGQTSKQILNRFEEDVSLFKPFSVIITIGGNDANPNSNLSLNQFKSNLRDLIKKTRALNNCQPILQTYYGIDDDNMIKQGRIAHVENFYLYMNTITEIAAEQEVSLLNHTPRWINYRKHDLKAFRELMHDDFHLNALGHQVWALDTLRYFGIAPLDNMIEVFHKATGIQNKFDELETK